MAARIWFLVDTPLPAAERQILNRAARMLEDQGVHISREVLSSIRTTYKPGMSANDLVQECDPRV